jgi:hypothetical protein
MGKSKDVEYAVNGASGKQRIFKTPGEASAFAVAMSMSRGGDPIHLDVLVYSAAGARAYRGSSDGAEEYKEDPDASVFDRIVVRADAIGRVA